MSDLLLRLLSGLLIALEVSDNKQKANYSEQGHNKDIIREDRMYLYLSRGYIIFCFPKSQNCPIWCNCNIFFKYSLVNESYEDDGLDSPNDNRFRIFIWLLVIIFHSIVLRFIFQYISCMQLSLPENIREYW